MSADEQYRFVLTRTIQRNAAVSRPCVFVMLNPSTADANNDDPTIRRCKSFAASLGATDLVVVNLFALRATDPKALLGHPDPVGPRNDHHIANQVNQCRPGMCILAWGSHPMAEVRARQLRDVFTGRHCLATTKTGWPRHPLYLPGSLTPIPWSFPT